MPFCTSAISVPGATLLGSTGALVTPLSWAKLKAVWVKPEGGERSWKEIKKGKRACLQDQDLRRGAQQSRRRSGGCQAHLSFGLRCGCMGAARTCFLQVPEDHVVYVV